MSKELLWELLEKQSNNPKNDVSIGKMRALSGKIFKQYDVKEFDYNSELVTLGQWLSNSKNYETARELVGKTVNLTGDYEFDDQVILGSFALSLGNIIRVDTVDDLPVVLQYIPKDFASKSGMGYSLGDGNWVALRVENRNEKPKLQKYTKPVNLNRESFAAQEILACGDAGIRTTAKRMQDITKEYLTKNTFRDDRARISNWAKSVLSFKGSSDKSKYLGILATTISNPQVIRYEKDPLCIQNGKLQSHEWLVVPGRTLESGVADCDDFTLLIGCLAGLMGLNVTYRIAGCDPKKPNSFSHVYPIVSYPKNSLDGIVNSEDVFVDIVYQKRIGDSAYGKEPRKFRYFDIKVI